MKNVIEHYDKLIDENNDPVHDPKPLRDYMDKWDGEKFIESMHLDKNKSVLEIGVGTGRIATKVVPLCNSFFGIDVSSKTVQRAAQNLSAHQNVRLVCDDFMSCQFECGFDVIYSSLTFMHIEDKLFAIKKIASLLNDNGVFALSIDKNQNEFIDMGTRKIKIYPDTAENIRALISQTELKLINQFELEHAYVIVSQKASLVYELPQIVRTVQKAPCG